MRDGNACDWKSSGHWTCLREPWACWLLPNRAEASGPPYLGLPEVVVHHGEVQPQLLHVAPVALEEQQVSVNLRVQGGQVVDVHVGAGAQQLGQEEARKGQLHQHVFVESLQWDEGQQSASRVLKQTHMSNCYVTGS